ALAPALVGDADDRDLGDRRVLAEDLLDLERRDLLAAALQDVDGGAAEQTDVAVGIERGDVAGAEPAVVGEGGAGAGVVAGEDARAAQPELAVDELGLDGGQGRTDRAGAAAGRVERGRAGDADLGHAEALER